MVLWRFVAGVESYRAGEAVQENVGNIMNDE
jgi:hypothetical protein